MSKHLIMSLCEQLDPTQCVTISRIDSSVAHIPLKISQFLFVEFFIYFIIVYSVIITLFTLLFVAWWWCCCCFVFFFS